MCVKFAGKCVRIMPLFLAGLRGGGRVDRRCAYLHRKCDGKEGENGQFPAGFAVKIAVRKEL